MLKIRVIEPAEIPLLKDFAPPDWSSDLSTVFSFHFGHPYFHPIAAELDGSVVGCAQGLLTGRSGWLGNIIVLPEYRGRGIGRALTIHLMEYFRSRGSTHQVLIATPLGESVYRNLGFRSVSQYIFLKGDPPAAQAEVPDIRRFDPQDAARLFALDWSITGEERQPLLSRFLADAWVHTASPSGELDGFFLPAMSQGPVLADNDRAGLALLRFKLGLGCKTVVFPEANTVALDFFLKAGFQETRRAPRMVLHEDLAWQPKRVYCRAAGYCG